MSSLQRKLQMGGLPPMPPPGLGGRGKKGVKRRDYNPVKWDVYFDRKSDIEISPGNVFRVYESGEEGPVCFFLHGGGFSALTWACLSKKVTNQVKCRCVAIDLRGHGDTKSKNELEVSFDNMGSDISQVVRKMYGTEPPPILLIGHSMGGALAVHVASKQLIPSLIGLTVIDVVEGTAIDALSSMKSLLRSRPEKFQSLEYAIEWSVRNGHVRNVDSAKVSMPGQLKRVDNGVCATNDITDTQVRTAPAGTATPGTGNTSQDSIREDEESSQVSSTTSDKQPASSSNVQYTWRIDLQQTSKYWKEWFEGLSNKFLALTPPKLLLLAGVDRLDKEMTVGQMQGKFQLQVLPQCGHAVQEDHPEGVADILSGFMVRHKVAQPTSNYTRVVPGC